MRHDRPKESWGCADAQATLTLPPHPGLVSGNNCMLDGLTWLGWAAGAARPSHMDVMEGAEATRKDKTSTLWITRCMARLITLATYEFHYINFVFLRCTVCDYMHVALLSDCGSSSQ